MKLLYCTRCFDIVRATMEWGCCECGRSRARYTDNINLEYEGPCLIVGFANLEFRAAVEETLAERDDPEHGREFTAFVISPAAKSLHRINQKDSGKLPF